MTEGTTAPSPLASDERRYGPFAALSWTLLLRAVVLLAGIVSIWTVKPESSHLSASGVPWLAWDGMHYANIVRYGYAETKPENENELVAYEPGKGPLFYEIAFFPLLPMMARPLTLFVSPEVSLVIIGNLCALAGFLVFYAWLRNITTTRTAFIGTMILAGWPGAVFFSAGLTEGPFLLIIAVTLYFLQKDHFWMAAMASAIGTILRPTGVAVAATVGLYVLIHAMRLPFFKRFAFACLIGVVASAGALAYEGFLWHRYHSFDAYVHAQQYWEAGEKMRLAPKPAGAVGADGQPEPARYSWRFFKEKAVTPQAWNRGLAILIVGVMLAGLALRSPIPRELFALAVIIFVMTALPNHMLRISSIVRYEAPVTPLFGLVAVWLAARNRQRIFAAMLAIGFIWQLYYAFLFSRGVWVG